MENYSNKVLIPIDCGFRSHHPGTYIFIGIDVDKVEPYDKSARLSDPARWVKWLYCFRWSTRRCPRVHFMPAWIIAQPSSGNVGVGWDHKGNPSSRRDVQNFAIDAFWADDGMKVNPEWPMYEFDFERYPKWRDFWLQENCAMNDQHWHDDPLVKCERDTSWMTQDDAGET